MPDGQIFTHELLVVTSWYYNKQAKHYWSDIHDEQPSEQLAHALIDESITIK